MALGRRTSRDTLAFTEKLREATTGDFQITTDGFSPYLDAVEYSLGMRVDFAQLVRVFQAPREGQQRYSPAGMEAVPVLGNPDPERIFTSQRRAPQPRHADADSQADAPDEWVQQKMGELSRYARTIFCLVQFLASSSNHPTHPGDGVRVLGPHMECTETPGVV